MVPPWRFNNFNRISFLTMKNTPEKVAAQNLKGIPREWFPWQHTLISSHSIATVDPILVEPLTGNTTVKLDMVSALQTNPTVTPLFSSAKVTDAVFFVPQRILTRGLSVNNFMELMKIDDIPLPTIPFSYGQFDGVTLTGELVSGFGYGSLLHRLGLVPAITRKGLQPVVQNSIASDVGTDPFSLNISPLLAYYLICIQNYTSPYVPYVPVPFDKLTTEMGPDSNVIIGSSREYSLVNMYMLRDAILRISGHLPDDSNSEYTDLYDIESYFPPLQYNNMESFGGILQDPIESLRILRFADQFVNIAGAPTNVVIPPLAEYYKTHASSTGLWPASFDADYQTLYFNSEDIDQLESVTITDDGQNTVLGLRRKESLFARIAKSVLRGLKYDDWLDIRFGSHLPFKDSPIFCGSNTMSIVFDDVLNTSGAGVQGTAVARGKALGTGMKEISFTALEPGYLMVLRTITPEVSYDSVKPRWTEMTHMSSYPQYDISGTAFQPLKVSDIQTFYDDADNIVIGEQPIYFDYMRKYNRVSGVFGMPIYDSYFFARNLGEDIDASDQMSVLTVGSPYIDPERFSYNFADVGLLNNQNYFIKTKFNLRVLQPIKRTILDRL